MNNCGVSNCDKESTEIPIQYYVIDHMTRLKILVTLYLCDEHTKQVIMGDNERNAKLR